MNKKTLRNFIISAGMFVLFVIYTIIIKFVDVMPVGALGTRVGLASLNKYVFNLVGVNDVFCTITEILGIFDLIIICLLVAIAGIQFIKRKSIKLVDKEFKLLACVYVLMACCYLFFEFVIVNYRPILVDWEIEASYPSSHVLLTLVVIGTGLIIANRKISNKKAKIVLWTIGSIASLLVVVGRVLGGVHWLTDVVGGALLATAIVMFYYSCVTYKSDKHYDGDRDKSTMQDVISDAETI